MTSAVMGGAWMWDKMMEETRLTVNRMGSRDKMVCVEAKEE